jgi:hypothetical protein
MFFPAWAGYALTPTPCIFVSVALRFKNFVHSACLRFMRFPEWEAIISLCIIQYLVFNGHVVFLCELSI